MQVKHFSSRYNTTTATDKQISQRQQQSYQKCIGEEYVYLNQKRNQTDVKNIENNNKFIWSL
jgi:hypothetical protein